MVVVHVYFYHPKNGAGYQMGSVVPSKADEALKILFEAQIALVSF